MNVLLKIPFLFSSGLFVKDQSARDVFGQRSETDIQIIFRKKFLLVGLDAYTGELAILSGLAQCWFKCDWIGRDFWQTKRCMIFLASTYFSKEDMRFKIGLLGFCCYLRIGQRIAA